MIPYSEAVDTCSNDKVRQLSMSNHAIKLGSCQCSNHVLKLGTCQCSNDYIKLGSNDTIQ